MTEWISVKDRLPDEGVEVLTFFECPISGYAGMRSDSIMQFQGNYEGPWFLRDHQKHQNRPTVTHWQPLPNPPGVA